MSSTPHPNPRLAARGVTLEAPTMKAVPAKPKGLDRADPARDTRQDLLDHLIEYDSIDFSVRSIELPADLSNHNAQFCDWFRIGSVDPEQVGQELVINGVNLTLCPCDTLGDGNQVIPYGDNLGTGAALVIGFNLPGGYITDEATGAERWTFAPFNRAGFNGTTAIGSTGFTTSHIVNPPRPGPKFVKEFPAGDLTSAPPIKQEYPKAFGALGLRLPYKSRLDIALVFRSGTVNGGVDVSSERYMRLHVVGQLMCAVTAGAPSLRSKPGA